MTARGPVTRIAIVDSHTEGEPTRVVTGGWPAPKGRTMAERRDDMRARADDLRRGVVLEPRGHDAIVGALLTPPVEPGSTAGVVFFNDVGYLGMCGHGTIGVVRTLQHLGRIGPGEIRLDTPVGTVGARLDPDGSVTIANVPAYVEAADVEIGVPGVGRLRGDVAWGGNWFFLAEHDGVPLVPARIPDLLALTTKIRDTLRLRRITGRGGAEVDHVELFGPPTAPGVDSRNFVLCPGAAYDRSPCGTGTSAKLAVLHRRGELAVGQRWVQESITGSTFTAWLEERQGTLVPHVRGRAYVTGEGALLFDPADPFRSGWQGG
ncbi:MAG: hydroxyproline-2-epimerase [Gemmatimonadetes bacterium 21-71-4]|nr:MAG: hydroxyproline-2-epimerase [Gemmatimonadetes bacterium 21-71-4]